LRRLIALGGLSPGERLPSERQLAETLQVGRDSIRAAMRILSDEALVETRLGRRGGTFVTDHPVQQQQLSAEILASHHEIMASYEFRRTVEPAAARLAARRADAEQIRPILEIAEERAWSVRSWRAVDSRFHMAVAEASGNAFFVDAIYRTRTAFFGWYDAIYSRVPWDTLPVQDRDFGYFHRPIAEAIAQQEDLEIVYLKPDDTKSRRRIRPEAFGPMDYQGKSFEGLRAFCYERKGQRTFRLDRMLEINRTG
jgi:DNA-binding FadR family transcriptional regulator